MRLAGQIALITGAARGIGLEVARRMLSEGAVVAIVDLDGAAATAAAAELAPAARAIGIGADITDEAQVEAAFARVDAELGPVTILVNNAGIYPHIPLEQTTLADWRKVMAVNLDSAFLCTRAAFGRMRPAGYGRIINLASEVAYNGLRNVSAYAAAKAGVMGLTRVAATEGGSHDITVNAVAPGLIETPGVMSQIAEHFDEILPLQAIQRRGQPGDIAGCILWLAGPETGFVTGQTISVNGGNSYR